jgi:4-hydroxythreonine-4-phosphate dehydrogenase
MSLHTEQCPAIALTLGDPAGVGPEIVLKALADPQIAPLARWIVVGDAAAVREAERVTGLGLNAHLHDAGVLREFAPGMIGRRDPRCGRAAIEYVRIATGLCLSGEAAAMVTAPINKEAVTEALQSEGRSFSGHTEYIAELCGVKEPRMLLWSERLSTIHVTTHIALASACHLDTDRIFHTIEIGQNAMLRLGVARPRIAVCGLNPHAGEHGLFGDEDESFIRPAVERARTAGVNCSGPHPADTVFLQASRGAYDLVVAMYHDQGHIPMKLLDFEGTVNISVGIPIIRTSVDHGTAFDIAGRNVADPRSIKQAMRVAVQMAAG